MQISTAFEFVRASSPTHAPRPQNISFTYNAEGHAGMALHPSLPTIHPFESPDQRRTAVDRSCELHEVPPRAPLLRRLSSARPSTPPFYTAPTPLHRDPSCSIIKVW